MKILLIQPPLTLLPNEIKSVVFPLGLAYIAAILEKNNYQVNILDAVAEGQNKEISLTSTINKDNNNKNKDNNNKNKDNNNENNDNNNSPSNLIHFGLSWEEIFNKIAQSNPDVVGISCLFSSQSQNAIKIAELVKQHNNKIKTIMGGAHPSSVPQDVLSNDNVDFVILGEGEETIIELLENIDSQAKLKDIPGIGFKENETKEIVINPKKDYIKNIDDLPFPARHLFPMELYLNSKYGHGTDLIAKPFTSMITSRGCPYNCVYCSVHTVWGRNYRSRSPKNVVDEIEHLITKYGIKEIHFEDDNLTLKKERTIEICKEIIKRNLKFKWTTPNGVALWTLDKKVLTWMKKAGCYKLCFGIESGDLETQKFIRKSIPLDQCQEIVKEANKLGIWTHGFFIIGFPFEDMNSINNTLKYSIDSDLDFASFFLATPYPKTDLYTIMQDHNLIGNLTWDMLRVSAGSINTKYFQREELVNIQKELFKKFVIHRLFNFTNPIKLSYRLKRFRNKEDIKFIIRYFQRFLQVVH